MQNESIKLSFREGSSDKVYQTELKEESSGWIVNFAYGRRGSTLTTGRKTRNPVEYIVAKKAYDSLVKSKTSEGYKIEGESGSISTVDNKTDSGIRPQLLNEISIEDAIKYIEDPLYCAQEKFDGQRKLIKKTDNNLSGINKKGLFVPLNFECIAEMSFRGPDFVIDGEDLGSKIMIFDNLSSGYATQPYAIRLGSLKLILSKHSLEDCIQIVPTAWTTDEKQILFDRLQKENAEGIVFKRVDSVYTPGRPASGGSQFKCKFYESASCIVTSVSDVKSSIGIKVYDDSDPVSLVGIPVGNVTVYPNQPTPKVGDIVEVKYLYYYPNGSLYQPVLLGIRNDVNKDECLLSKLKEKQS